MRILLPTFVKNVLYRESGMEYPSAPFPIKDLNMHQALGKARAFFQSPWCPLLGGQSSD
jgi:hypothetical protein